MDGGGLDGGAGTYLANTGDDVHAVGTLDPIVPGHVGCMVIQPDGSRYLARAEPDPLAQRRNQLAPVPFAAMLGVPLVPDVSLDAIAAVLWIALFDKGRELWRQRRDGDAVS